MKKISLLVLISLTLTALLLAACTNPAVNLAGTTWTLVSYGTKDQQTPAAQGVETSLVFATDGTVSGSFGCNSFGGKYVQKEGTVTFSEVISTMMACQEPRMSQESTSYKVLNGTASFVLEGSTLTLTAESGDAVIVLAAAASTK